MSYYLSYIRLFTSMSLLQLSVITALSQSVIARPEKINYVQGDAVRFFVGDSVKVYNDIEKTVFIFSTKLEGPSYYFAEKPLYVDNNGNRNSQYIELDPRINRNGTAYLGQLQAAGLYQIGFKNLGKEGDSIFNIYGYSGYNETVTTQNSYIKPLVKTPDEFTASMDHAVDVFQSIYQKVNLELLKSQSDSMVTKAINKKQDSTQESFRYDVAIIYAKNQHLLLCITGDSTTIKNPSVTRGINNLDWPLELLPVIIGGLADTSISNQVDANGKKTSSFDVKSCDTLNNTLQLIKTNLKKVQFINDPGLMQELLSSSGVKDEDESHSFFRLVFPDRIYPQMIFVFRFQYKKPSD